MPVNQRQYDQLTEMGINLWQHKIVSTEDDKSNLHNEQHEALYTSQDNLSLSDLTKQTLFTDILSSCGVSIGEITAKKDHLDLGVFNWYFTEKPHDISPIQCKHNTLFSPSISLISQSPALKKQLWLTISTNLL
jgi:hypothetical protein